MSNSAKGLMWFLVVLFCLRLDPKECLVVNP